MGTLPFNCVFGSFVTAYSVERTRVANRARRWHLLRQFVHYKSLLRMLTFDIAYSRHCISFYKTIIFLAASNF